MGVLARNIKGSEPISDALRESSSSPARAPEYGVPQNAPQASSRYAGPSIISAGLTVIGRLECSGDIQIDGKVEGDVSGHVVRIGAGATVKGTVFGEMVELAGCIEGKIEGKSAVLAKTARMIGDIAYQSLQIDTGASFNGNCRQHNERTAAKGDNLPCCPDPIEAANGSAEAARLN